MNEKEVENVVIRLKPKDLSTIYQTTKLGLFRVLWHKEGKDERTLNIKFDQIVMIKCSSLTKAIPKKDIHTVKIKIEKKLDFEFPNIEMYLKENPEQQHPGIKILNIEKDVT